MTAMAAAGAPAQRLLAQSVMASTHQLVRSVRDGRQPAAIRGLMGERRRLLAELARYVNVPGGAGSLAALEAAVNESDRTLEKLIG
jgi:hypothetical protein